MTLPERAQQMWQVLLASAHLRQVLTYSHLADLIGMGAGTLAPGLTLIMEYCHQNDLPPLTVLVVKKDTGLPGEGLTTLEDLPRDRETVFNHSWFAMAPVQVSDFAKVMASRVPMTSRQRSRSSYSAKERSNYGAVLNEEWGVGAKHALYHKDGHWYHQLREFPGALFDPDGYILFETEEDFRSAPQLRIEKDVNVDGVISEMPGYVRVRE